MFNKITGRGKHKIQILRNFEGLVRSGEMLVVLGRPGSGCSTLLKTIAGETHGFYIDSKSEINYQGIPKETMHKDFRGECMYQAEVDVHFPQLTVGQTLNFAAQARAPRNRIPGVTREQYAKHMTEVIMAVFGLSHTYNTKVGNDFVRGVSGGERKRVSIAEAALGGSPLQCWDNSTRGLDSATALEFVKTLRLSTSLAGSTAAVAIYQASQSIYDIFDKVVVLYEGRQIYFGPTTSAKEFFVNMGFVCTERATTGDFLTSLTNPAERIIREGFEHLVPRTPDEFAAAWQKSEERARLLQEIEEFDRQYPVGGEQLKKFQHSRKATMAKGQRANSPYTISVPMQVRLCIQRGFQRLRGDMSLALSGIIGNTIMALIIGSVFYDLPVNSGTFYSRGALLFFAILLNAFSSFLEVCCRQMGILNYLAYNVTPDIDALRAKRHCREAFEVRFLSSVLRGYRIHDLRLAEQVDHINVLQPYTVFYDQSSTNAGRLFHLLPLLFRLCLDYVHGFQNHWCTFSYSCSGYGACSGVYSGLGYLHWLHSSDPRYASL